MLGQKIDYKKIINKSLLNAVKEIINSIATDGLHKKQHLYITFATNHPYAKLSDELRKDFEDEITIILQYEFWDLKIDNFGVSVKLSFAHGMESLYIPFSSIILIQDPSENFELELSPDMESSPLVLKNVETEKQKSVSESNVISLDMFRKGK